jgi:GntR family transcriptional regulator/MocR family aminotransferase
MAEFIERGLFARHVRKVRGVYEARHRKVVDMLQDAFATHLEVIQSSSGLHVCALARTASSDQLHAVLTRASAAGVEVHELARYAIETPRAGLLFGYGAIPLERIEEGLRRLLDCFGE